MDWNVMGRSVRQPFVIVAVLTAVTLPLKQTLASSKFAIGLKVGVTKLEGDWRDPRINPGGSLLVSYDVLPHLALVAQVNASALRSKTDVNRLNPEWAYLSSEAAQPGWKWDADKFRVYAAPIDLALQWNFFPLSRINPFTLLGGGVLWWNAKYDDDTLVRNGDEQRHYTPFARAGGGFEYRLNRGFAVSIGGDFRYTGSDRIDQFAVGDEWDGLISLWTGIRFSFDERTRADIDGDNIPEELDLAPWVAEDRDGYLDHDGRPDIGVPAEAAKKAPVVIHQPVFRAEQGRDLNIKTKILSTVPLRIAAVLFRSSGSKSWNVVELAEEEEMVFTATLDGGRIVAPGLEYCVVAVDQRVKGIGYSGLPTRPIRVKVIKNATPWRVIGGIVSALSWGAAGYLVLRKQK